MLHNPITDKDSALHILKCLARWIENGEAELHDMYISIPVRKEYPQDSEWVTYEMPGFRTYMISVDHKPNHPNAPKG